MNDSVMKDLYRYTSCLLTVPKNKTIASGVKFVLFSNLGIVVIVNRDGTEEDYYLPTRECDNILRTKDGPEGTGRELEVIDAVRDRGLALW